MDYNEYLNLIKNREFDKACKFKDSQIPSALFKYYCLDNRYKLNEEKLNCLADGKIYLCDFSAFNDPFEGNFLIYDNKALRSKGWNRELIDSFCSMFKNNFKIGCLSNTNEHNMPLWAYYANNHEGFCVEYHMSEKQRKYIFPVVYEPKRLYANSIITHIINGIQELIEQGKAPDDISGDLNFYQQLMFLALTAKHKSWEHEKEYRILTPFDKYFPAMPKKIFIGLNCKDEYKNKLVDIGNKFNRYCEVYQMVIERDSENFDFIEKRII